VTASERSRPESSSAAPRRATATEPRRPYHLGVVIGVSAGIYAASLTGVTLVQIEQDRRLVADREPVSAAIDALTDHHDTMEASLASARAIYDEASARYGAVVKGASALHAAVDRLGRRVAAIEGTTVTSGGSFRLPAAPGKPSAGSASGGGSAAQPPSSNGTSGASGKP
jgi:hypothetical protein